MAMSGDEQQALDRAAPFSGNRFDRMEWAGKSFALH